MATAVQNQGILWPSPEHEDRAMWKFTLFLAILVASGIASAQTKCDASINGYRIKTVYITGGHYNAVVWAYKHLSDETCLTPTTDPAKADAILDLPDSAVSSAAPSDDSFFVTCSSMGASSSCLDSDGNEMDIDCDGMGNCFSYFGPSPTLALLGAFSSWVKNASYQGEARLYTPDHKLIWKSEAQKAQWPNTLWYQKLRAGTNSPTCSKPAFTTHYYKNYRQLAAGHCKVEFSPRVSIDIKANARLAAKQATANQKQAETDEMKRNAKEAAAKQKAQN